MCMVVISVVYGFDFAFSPDISAFKNFAHSNQGDNQVNIEYGLFVFRDLNMTIIAYSKSANVTSLAIFKVTFSTPPPLDVNKW